MKLCVFSVFIYALCVEVSSLHHSGGFRGFGFKTRTGTTCNSFSLADRQRLNSFRLDAAPRLYRDIDGLIEWIEKDENNGVFDAAISEHPSKGWTLVALEPVKPKTTLLQIPKKLCIFSDPDIMNMPLLDNTKVLMKSLSDVHWRARLAIALLSERVKPESFFAPYLKNLPFEFWGMPVFFSASEFR